MHVVYANCLGAPAGDLLVTDEVAVAARAPEGMRTLVADELVDPDRAEALNVALWPLAFDWAARGGDDPTAIDGVSAADLAGGEAISDILLPAARGVLDAGVLLDREQPSEVTVVLPETGTAYYRRYERVQAEAFAAAIEARTEGAVPVHRLVSTTPSATLTAKYEQTRDPAHLPERELPGRRRLVAACAAVNAATRLRHRAGRRVFVIEYHPTSAFAARATDATPLVRMMFPGHALPEMVRRGDRGFAPPHAAAPGEQDHEVAARLAAFAAEHRAELEQAFAIDGVGLWPVTGPELLSLAGHYAVWLRRAAPAVRRALRRGRVGAVLVPFDTLPVARLIVRRAQADGIPTLILNDGWKGDDYGLQGMTADVPLAASQGVLDQYFRRHPNAQRGRLVGDPRADAAPPPRPAAHSEPGPLRTLLVGSFTFSPLDLNCRRSDPERFLGELLDAVRASEAARGARVVLKLHPADRTEAYADVLAARQDLQVEVVDTGDVADLFAGADLYVTTYSTSLLQAAAAGLPFAYFAVNPQRLHPPFHPDDPIMGPRLARTGDDLRRLLDDPAVRRLPSSEDIARWVQHHAGPSDGRCAARVEAAVREAMA